MNPHEVRPVACAPAGESEAGASTSTTDKIAATARDAATKMKSAAGETASRVKMQAQRLASETKAGTADRIGGYSTAVHESARSLEQRDPNIAWATHRAADRLQDMADYLRASDFDQLRHDAEAIARRHPVAFFGGMVVAGLAIGNLLKARRPDDEDPAFEETATEEDIGLPPADTATASDTAAATPPET